MAFNIMDFLGQLGDFTNPLRQSIGKGALSAGRETNVGRMGEKLQGGSLSGPVSQMDWGKILPALLGAGVAASSAPVGVGYHQMEKERADQTMKANALLEDLISRGYVPIEQPYEQTWQDFLKPGANLNTDKIAGAITLPNPILAPAGPGGEGYKYFKKIPSTSELDMLKYYMEQGKAGETARHNRAMEGAKRAMTYVYNSRQGDTRWQNALSQARQIVSSDLSMMGASADEIADKVFEIADGIYSTPMGGGKKFKPTPALKGAKGSTGGTATPTMGVTTTTIRGGTAPAKKDWNKVVR